MVNQVVQLTQAADLAKQPSSPSGRAGWGRADYGFPFLAIQPDSPSGKPDGVSKTCITTRGSRPWQLHFAAPRLVSRQTASRQGSRRRTSFGRLLVDFNSAMGNSDLFLETGENHDNHPRAAHRR